MSYSRPSQLVVQTEADLPTDNKLLFLREREQKCYLQKPVTQQLPWLLGRLAAKKAIQDFFATHNQTLQLTDIEVYNTETGSPSYILHDEIVSRTSILLSISHTSSCGVALVTPENNHAGIGIDIEQIRAFNTETISHFLTPAEYRLYQGIDVKKQPQMATIYWTLKEAYLKAIGTGLRTHPQRIMITFDNGGCPSAYESNTGKLIQASLYYEAYEGYIISTVVL
ncbi:MAG: 4'-phosphopantetheinyl transferase superfamily protein [Candidatus Kaiserbacteria bacterium]|nr:4'-phosphopantetheinyl transferase superfamily protein [Candidatus Kaiserbacteria bacterium]MCB9816451.1 4'-phosphopantetheinyl transferase superfamily protein [Candidatus Nomurabacteria bacterium]